MYLNKPLTFNVKKLIGNQHTQMLHVETRDWQSNIAFRSAPNRGTAEKNYIIHNHIKILIGRDFKVEKNEIPYGCKNI